MSWEDNVRRVVPYVAGEQPNKTGMIKLNTNECPYPPAPGVAKLLKEMDHARFRLYPDPEAKVLAEALSAHYHVSKDRIFTGVGSDDVLSMAFLTFFNSEKPILFPDITYSFYDVWASLYRIPFKTCPLKDDWHIDAKDYKQENGGIIFPNPNAPTGLWEKMDIVEEIVKSTPDSVVIVDEAYIDFGGESALPLIDKYENLLVVQTFSKSRAMAGMRIGFCMGNEKLIGYLEDAKFSFNSYTLNMPAQILGAEAVNDDVYFKEITGKIIQTREKAKEKLRKLGFSFPDSKANFIFASHERVPAREIFQKLREKDIYVRYWDKPRINNSLRITVGTDEEMEKLVEALREIVEAC